MAFSQVSIRMSGGTEYGPISGEELLAWHAEGRIPADCMVVDRETGESEPAPTCLGRLLGLQPAPTTPPVLTPAQQVEPEPAPRPVARKQGTVVWAAAGLLVALVGGSALLMMRGSLPGSSQPGTVPGGAVPPTPAAPSPTVPPPRQDGMPSPQPGGTVTPTQPGQTLPGSDTPGVTPNNPPPSPQPGTPDPFAPPEQPANPAPQPAPSPAPPGTPVPRLTPVPRAPTPPPAPSGVDPAARQEAMRLVNEASGYIARRDKRTAMVTLVSAINKDPHCIPAHFKMAWLAWDTGNKALARKEFETVIAIAPNSAQAMESRKALQSLPQ